MLETCSSQFSAGMPELADAHDSKSIFKSVSQAHEAQ